LIKFILDLMDAKTIISIVLVLAAMLTLWLIMVLIDEANRQSRTQRRHQRPWNPVRTAPPKGAWIVFGLVVLVLSLSRHNAGPAYISSNQQPITLPAFSAQGAIPGPLARVEIRNSVPYAMDVSFQQGDQTYRLAIPPCDRCQIYNDHPPQCPPEGVSDRIEISPGSYKVAISWRGNSNPYMGEISFVSSTAYSECFTVGYGRKNT
jgi:hypothetical protein